MIAAVAVTAAALVVVLVRVLVERGFAFHGDGALATVDPLRDRPGEPTP